MKLNLVGNLEIIEMQDRFYPPLITIGGKSLQDAIIETFFPNHTADRWSLPKMDNALDHYLPRQIGNASIEITRAELKKGDNDHGEASCSTQEAKNPVPVL